MGFIDWHGLVGLHLLSLRRLVRLQRRRHNQRNDILTDRLACGEAEYALGAIVPAGDDALIVVADNCVFRAFNDGGQATLLINQQLFVSARGLGGHNQAGGQQAYDQAENGNLANIG